MPAQTGYFDTLKSVAGKVFTYLASITLTGTDGKTITVTQNTSLDEAVAMSSKLTKPGGWTAPAFDAGNFTADGAMTWTVEAGDVQTLAYTIIDKTMVVTVRIVSSTVGGTPSTGLLILIPAGKTATKTMQNICRVDENGTSEIEEIRVTAAGTQIAIYRFAGNHVASTNATLVFAQITFEIN